MATRRRLVSAEYFGYLLVKRFIFVYVFFKQKFEPLISLFLNCQAHTSKTNNKSPSRVTIETTRIWANAQRDGHPAYYTNPLLNAEFG